MGEIVPSKEAQRRPFFLMHPLSTPWKHQKTVRFSDVFKGYKGAFGTNGLRQP